MWFKCQVASELEEEKSRESEKQAREKNLEKSMGEKVVPSWEIWKQRRKPAKATQWRPLLKLHGWSGEYYERKVQCIIQRIIIPSISLV